MGVASSLEGTLGKAKKVLKGRPSKDSAMDETLALHKKKRERPAARRDHLAGACEGWSIYDGHS